MAETNPNARLETFYDGVLAIAITLLIIDLKIPATPEIKNTADFWYALALIIPSASDFVLSFIIIFITWVNQHNVFKLININVHCICVCQWVCVAHRRFHPVPNLVGWRIHFD